MKRLYLLFVLLMPLVAFAQSVLSLEDCILLAKEYNKRISAADFQMQWAKYERRAAFANFLPMLSVESMCAYSTANGLLGVDGGVLPVVGADGVPTGAGAYFPGINFDYEIGWLCGAGVKLRQSLYMGGKIIAGYRMGRIGEEIARQNSRLTEAEVITETARAYANVVKAVKLQRVAESYYTLLGELMRSVEKAHERGVKSRNDVLKVEVKLDEGRLALRRSENAIRLARMNLCHYIGRPLTDTVEVNGELPLMDYSFVSSADISSRPEVQMLAQKSELMRQKVNMARAELRPQIGLVGQYGYLNGVKFGGKKLMDDWIFIAGVQISIPILNAGAHLHYRSAKMQYRQTKLEAEAAIELLALEAAQAANSLDESFFEQMLAQKGAASAAENMRVSGNRYRAGVETLADYLEAQTLWLKAEEVLVEACINRFLSLLEYHKATGTIDGLFGGEAY